ncbi:Hypothetical predicted protein [Olea europaea subsp. europaea]|uniref:Uncharacterized protein n=1 Tax=Olea europaea subsp. europaea TaxID=158383 RepID=A0A8S0R1X3_OLEEU|nr:Hypothetical predicted protein [Olea europaea subsp. europaea]
MMREHVIHSYDYDVDLGYKLKGYSPNGESALFLLSSKDHSLIPYTDLPSRCSTALHRLIEENRAVILATQLNLHQMKIADPTQKGSVWFLNNQIIYPLDLIQALLRVQDSGCCLCVINLEKNVFLNRGKFLWDIDFV